MLTVSGTLLALSIFLIALAIVILFSDVPHAHRQTKRRVGFAFLVIAATLPLVSIALSYALSL